jgi:curved DNA-binding protein CbpA
VTHYEVLGVPQTASTADVRRAFLALARRFHPDVHVLADAATQRTAARRMQAVNDAWAVLGDAGRRATYDEELRRARARSTPTGTGGPASGGSASGGSASSRTAWAGPADAGPRSWPRAEAAPSAGPADWRRHASPGPALSRPRWARLVAVVPVALLLGAVVLLGAGLVLRVPELGSLAVAVAIVAVLAFVAAPILAMKEARRAQRPRRR